MYKSLALLLGIDAENVGGDSIADRDPVAQITSHYVDVATGLSCNACSCFALA